MMTRTIYLHADKDSMWEAGEDMGFTGEVLRMFSFTCCEVELEVEVDEKTGSSRIIKVDGQLLEAPNAAKPTES